MKILNVGFDSQRPISLWLLSDLHLGHMAHDSRLLDVHRTIAKQARAKMVFLGDALEAVTSNSSVAAVGGQFEQEGTVGDQLDRFVQTVRGFRVLALLEGNHERRVTRVTGYSILTHAAESIARQQGKPCEFLPHGGLLNIRVGEVEYHIAVHHGEGGPTSFFRGMMRDYDAVDLVAGGHTHQLIREDVLRHTPDGTRTVICLRTGSYLPLPNYAQEKIGTYSPPAPGSWLVTLHPDKRRIEVKSLQDLAIAKGLV